MYLDKNDPLAIKEYEDFIYNSEFSNIYQIPEWAEIKAGWESHCFYQKKEDKVISAIQLLSIMNDKAGKKMYYAPRGPVCDLYDIDLSLDLLKEVRDFVKSKDAFLLKIDPQVPFDAELVKKYLSKGVPFSYNMYSYIQWPFSMRLYINGRSYEEIIQSFSKNTRKEVRRSYRQGLEHVVGKREDIEEFYRLTVEMCKNKGILHRPKEYFYRLYDTYKDMVHLSFVKHEDRYLCASLMIYFNGWGVALYGADALERDLGQSYLLDAEEIRFCAENGLKYYDLGGVRSLHPQNGLYRFKRKLTNDNSIFWIGNIEYVLDPEAYNKFIEGKEETDYTPPELF